MDLRVALALLGATLAGIAILVALMGRNPFLARIGARNIARRGLRTSLIVFGLMLATTLVMVALIIDDTLVQAVKSVAVAQIGQVDEQIDDGASGLALFPQTYANGLLGLPQRDPHIAGIAPALVVADTLAVDQTSRQAHGDLFALGLIPTAAGSLADLRLADGSPVTLAQLANNEIYLNQSAAQELHAGAGDTVYLYSPYWPGSRFHFTVRAVITAGPLGKRASALMPMDVLQAIAHAPGQINRVYVANAGNALTAADDSDAVAQALRPLLPDDLRIHTSKKDAITFALQAQGLFGEVVTLYILFTFAIDLMLLFLVFALLIAERRVELGTVRALGVHRGQVAQLLVFEGAIYEFLAALPGAAAGIGLGLLVIAFIDPTSSRFGFPLRVQIAPGSVIGAICLGMLFTLGAILSAVWITGRLTIAAALRGQPEPPAPQPSLLRLTRRALVALPRSLMHPAATLSAWGRLLWNLTWRGWVPLAVGIALAREAQRWENPLLLMLGLIAAASGVTLIARWVALTIAAGMIQREKLTSPLAAIARATRVIDRVSALAFGVICLLFWLLPVDPLRLIKQNRFAGGVGAFFVAGVLLVISAVFAAVVNLDLILAPLQRWLTRFGRWRHITYIAVIYPSAQRWRTGLGLAMFSLVCFSMVVMACIAASTTQRYAGAPDLSAGYDIIGRPLFADSGNLTTVQATIQRTAPADATRITAISAAQALPLGVIQPGANVAGWRLYPVSAIQGAFLQGEGLPLAARAQGYATDAAVWQAVRTQPGMVVIDTGALNEDDAAALGVKRAPPATLEDFAAPPIASTLLGPTTLESVLNRPDTQDLLQHTTDEVRGLLSDPAQLHAFTLQLSQVVTNGQFTPTPLWLGDFRGGGALKVTVIGLVDNAQGQRYGILGSPDTFAPVENNDPPLNNEYYYFQLQPGTNADAVARDIGSALLDSGFETTVIQEALLDLNAPRVYASQVLVALVGLLLLIGTAALMVTGSRSVVERRQQIGMLRALGFHRSHVQMVFLLEALVIAVGGAVCGLALGVLLCRNAFAAGVFADFNLGLALVVPLRELLLICGAAISAAVLAAILPAWQASRIAPAEALRYE